MPKTILNEEGEPVRIYLVEVNERASSVLLWLAYKEGVTATEYLQKIFADFLIGSLEQLSDKEVRDFLGATKVEVRIGPASLP